MANPVVRLTVNLDPDVADQLKGLAKQWDTTTTAALHRSIATTALLQERLDEGAKILLQNKDEREVREMTFG